MSLQGQELNARVWSLFDKAGFETKPNESDSSEEVISLPGGYERPVDMAATIPALGVTVIAQNSGAQNLNAPRSSFIHDLAALMAARGASAGLLVWTQQQIHEEDRASASARSISIWDRAQLEYFEAIADAIGEYARYEIIHSFGLRTNEETLTYKSLALRFVQPREPPNSELYMFTINPERLLKTCVIYRRAQGDASAYQRMLQRSRLPKVRSFVTSSGAILPTDLIVHLSDNILWDPVDADFRDPQGRIITLSRPGECELGILSIPLEYASIELIDGQHRLFGFVGTDRALRDNYNLAVVGVKNLTPAKRRDLFVSINDNSRRMDANLVAYLKYTENEEDCQQSAELMAIRLAVALNRQSALANRIKVLDVGQKPITLKGISGYDLRSLVRSRGLLRKYHGPNSVDYIQVLRTYFSVVASTFPSQWNEAGTYIISTNRGISALLKLLKSMFKTVKRPLEVADFQHYLQALKTEWPDDDWRIDKLRGRYVGSAGWNEFHRDLVQAILRRVPDFKQ